MLQIYVQSFPGPGNKLAISTKGGNMVKWRGDGRELFYLSPDNKLMAVGIKAGGSGLEPGAPQALFDMPREVEGLTLSTTYDASADGQRFLLLAPVEETTATPLTVVLNWAAELK